MSADSSGMGHMLKKLPLEIPGGHFGGFNGSNIKKSGKDGQTAGTIGTKLCAHMQMDLGMYTC